MKFTNIALSILIVLLSIACGGKVDKTAPGQYRVTSVKQNLVTAYSCQNGETQKFDLVSVHGELELTPAYTGGVYLSVDERGRSKWLNACPQNCAKPIGGYVPDTDVDDAHWVTFRSIPASTAGLGDDEVEKEKKLDESAHSSHQLLALT